MPFKIVNVPNINEVVHKWSQDAYMINKFGNALLRATTSKSNHFRYSI